MSIKHVVAISRELFDAYAADESPETLQGRLAAWQGRNFAPPTLEQMALGVCEEAGELASSILGAAWDWRYTAADAIADTGIYAMQAATLLRLDWLTLVPVVAPSKLTIQGTVLRVASASGRLAHVALKRSQGIRGMDDREAFIEAAARALADLGEELGRAALALDRDFVSLMTETAEKVVLKREWRDAV